MFRARQITPNDDSFSVDSQGVDVEACSFVVSFDPIKTVKSYIQMKGRARQQSAKFYVFAEIGVNEALSLASAQAAEVIVHQFIADREEEYIQEFNTSSNNLSDCRLECAEEKAMHNEQYKTSMSFVDLSSSKSLLNRYALSVPVDPSSRTSKQAILRKFFILYYLPQRLQEVTSDFCYCQSTCLFTKNTR